MQSDSICNADAALGENESDTCVLIVNLWFMWKYKNTKLKYVLICHK